MSERQRDIFLMYKRSLPKEHIEALERLEIPGRPQNGVSKEIGNPSWKGPLPHILVATISSFLYGYHLGVVNDTLEIISSDLGFNGDTMAEGLIVGICLAGAFLGSMVSGWIADWVGRRRAFQLSALPVIIGSSISATASTLGGMLIGRLLVGTAMGFSPPVAALYVSEVSPAFVRGTYGTATQIATSLGLMSVLFIGIPAKDVTGWWRVCFWFSLIPAALLAILMNFCAESPHWLFKKGRVAESAEEFEKLFGASHVQHSIAELSRSDKGDELEPIKFSELLHGSHFKVVYICSALFALQQLSGINAVFCFSSTVFKSAGVPSDLATISIGIVTLAGSIIAMILMDKLGRKALLVWSFLGMAASMSLQVTAASVAIVPGFGVDRLHLSVVGMLLFVLAYSLGAGPVPSLILSEILPSRIRGKAIAVCMVVHWIINVFIGLFFLRLLEQLGAQILYTFFATCCLTAVLFVKKNVIETKGKTLHEIELALLQS